MSEHEHQSQHVEIATEATDPVPHLSIGTWISLGGMLFALGGSWASYKVQSYQLEETRTTLSKHLDEDRASHEKTEARELKLDEALQSIRADHGTRITVLEERYATILTTLAGIDKKLDTLADHHR